jgi:hypothetical protein
MGSGILELVQQSQYSNLFNINPQVTFFRVIYHKYTHYAKESIVEYFDSTPDWGQQVTLTLSKVGDLVHRMYLVCEISLNLSNNLTVEQMNSFFSNIDITVDPLRTLIENRINVASTLSLSLVTDIITQLDVGEIIDRIRSGTLTNYSNEPNAISDINADINVNLDNTYYTFKPAHLDNIAENTTNTITVSELLELYEPLDIYRAYLVIDYLYDITSLSSTYTKNTFNIIDYKNSVNTLLTHPILKILNVTSNVIFKQLFAHFIISDIFIDIGGNKIDEYDSHYYNCYTQLNKIFDNKAYQAMITPQPNANGNFILYIPLIFWFNLYNSLALPCIALKYHDIVLNVSFNTLNNLVSIVPNNTDLSIVKLSSCYILTEYISVAHHEKVKFTTLPLEYLIVQTQVISQSISTAQQTISMDIDFFHPCKELIWIVLVTDSQGNFDQNYYIPGTQTVPITSTQIIINNEIIGSDNSTYYYSVIQPNEKHSRIPANGINVYSFSLAPEEYQPSGSLNLSYIPNRSIQVTLDPLLLNSDYNVELIVYAVNYNILRIANGFARLFYE